MGEEFYSVKIDNTVIAKEMSIGNAVILVKALFQEWYRESDLSITIVKEKHDRCCGDAEN